MDLSFESFVLAGVTADLSEEPAAREHADAVEFRMDLAADPLAALADYDGDLPIIATDRIDVEGGDSPPGEERRDRLRTAAREPAVAAVDVELGVADSPAGEDLLSDLDEAGVDTVVSVHDFEGTPSPERMGSVLGAAAERGDVAKLAVTAEDPGDALQLLTVTWRQASAGNRVATMAMGEAGRHTRAVAPAYGSRIGYAPVVPAQATAPGQYDLATLAELVDRLR
ncbi:type I 3-dehydroquinate dehydratase [Halobacteriales archaeon QS_8_69_26]|nr:MAG: type I 3-dehydroquinate dehydratase [Halobacteriales archaeon QS_8_69_26]